MHSIKLVYLASGLDLISLLFWLFSLQRVVKKLFYHQFLFPKPCTEALLYLSLLGAALKWSGRQLCCIYLFNVSPSMSRLSLSIFILHFHSFALFWFLVQKFLLTSTVNNWNTTGCMYSDINKVFFPLLPLLNYCIFLCFSVYIYIYMIHMVGSTFMRKRRTTWGIGLRKGQEILLIILEQTHCVLLNI